MKRVATSTRGLRSAPSRTRADATPKRADYIGRNKAAWESWASLSAANARSAWESDALRWGIWRTRESELHLLEGLEPGADVIELGCGPGAVCAWLTRLGFRPVGVDFVRAQLETAAALEAELSVHFPLLCADVERLHFADDSFDCAISEFGASLWCDPSRWLCEAYRVLRPGGLLVFFTCSMFLMACTPENGDFPAERLTRSYFSSQHVEFPGEDGAVEFHVTHGRWIELLRKIGFELEGLVETQPAADAPSRTHLATRDWARRWPTEEIWTARKRV